MARNVEDVIESLPTIRRLTIEKRAAILLQEERTLQEVRRMGKIPSDPRG